MILVDDGSPDNCPIICDEYAATDSRIKVIHKENGGLVSARQAGIEIAQGDYVFHLDGDDAIVPNALESAHKIILETKADIVSFSYKTCINGEVCSLVHDLVDEGLYNKAELQERVYPNLLSNKNMKNLFYFLWGKAIKRELATKHQMNVSRAISMGEDVSCSTPCYLDANSVYMSKKAIYLYTVRDDSITTTFKISQISQVAYVVEHLRNLDIKKPVDFDAQLSRYSCYLCFAILAAAAEGGHFKYLDEIEDLILNSINKDLIKKAEFKNITLKSKITITLMKKERIKTAFYFLNFIGKIKRLLKKG